MARQSVYTEILKEVVVVRFRFDNGLEAFFMGPPLPPGYGAIAAIDFSRRVQLPDDQALGVRANGVVEFLNLKHFEERSTDGGPARSPSP